MSTEDVAQVLIVDDDADLRQFLRQHLEAGFRILEAADGASALETVRRELPDIVVSDVMMPGLDGYELVKALRSDRETDFIPVVLLTARAGTESAVVGLDAGADDYVIKPFDPIEVEARVRGLIASRRHLKARFAGDAPALRPGVPEVASDDELFLARLTEALESRIGDSDYSIDDLARAVDMSRVTLYRRTKALLNESPSESMRRYRLERAAQLLALGRGDVSEVAYGVGFASVSHFCKCFREAFGSTPASYAQQA